MPAVTVMPSTRALSEQTSPSRRIRDSTGSRSQAVTTTMEEKLV